jgi:hypothetical protein
MTAKLARTSLLFLLTACANARDVHSDEVNQQSRTPLAGSVSFVQQASAAASGPASAFTAALSSATTAGDTLLVAFDFSAGTVASVTDSQGNTYSEVGTELVSPGGAHTRVYVTIARGGPDSVTVALSASSSYLEVYLTEYSGVDGARPVDTQASGAGTSASVSSGNATTSAASDYLYGFCIGDLACGAGLGFTTRSSFHGNLVEDMPAAAAGVYAATASADAGWTMQLVALRPAAQASDTTPPSVPTTGPLTVLASNPRYFTDGTGKAIYLVGSHTWSNGMEDRGTISPPPAFDFDGYIAFMVAHRFNWMRLWTTEMAEVSTNDDPDENIISGPYKWSRTGPGTANDGSVKFDLSKLDQAYFDRMRARVIQAGENGIYVSVQLFNGYMYQFDVFGQDGNPFESTNNVNGVSCPGTCPTDNSQLPAAVWAYETAYLQKVVDTVNDLGNVMYEVSNEAGPYSTPWQASVISFVKNYEATKLFQHPIGMTFQFSGGSDSTLFSSDADWVSPSAQLPTTTGKVVINDTDHSYGWPQLKGDGQAAQRAWAWKNLLLGNNTAFMDPYLVVWDGRNAPGGTTADPKVGTTVDPYWDVLRNAMRDTQIYASKVDLAAMTPQPAVSSTGYCLASVGSEYLVYQPGSGSFTVSLPAPGDYSFEWFDPSTGAVAQTGAAPYSSNPTFTPPFGGDAVLYLKAGATDVTPPSVPANLSATAVSASQIDLAWSASTDDFGVAGYRIIRNGTQVGSTMQTTFIDAGLSASATYSYTVAAFDAAGNVSAQSTAVSATTTKNAMQPIAFVQSSGLDCGIGNGCSLAFTQNSGAGNLLVVGIRVGDVNHTVGVSDSAGNAYALAARQPDTDGDEGFVFYAVAGGGADQVSVASDGAAATIRLAIHEFSGLSTLDRTVAAAGTSNVLASGSTVTTAANEVIFGFGISGDAETWTAGSGFTLMQTPGGKAGSEYEILSTAQAANAGFTLGASDPWSAIVATFR